MTRLSKVLGLLLVQLSGLALVVAGLFMLAPWLGVLGAGLTLCLVGWVLDGGK